MADSDEDEFEKKFSEIISSDELKQISSNYVEDGQLSIKELILIQKSLMDALANVNEIIQCVMSPDDCDAQPSSEEIQKIGIIYRACEDFNDCVAENFVIFTIDENDLEEDDLEDEEDGDI